MSGFLGSGKTSLLNALLTRPECRDSAVIVNELGAVAIDHLLIDVRGESLALLDNGCLCCALRTDLPEAFARLDALRAEAGHPPFRRVLLELSGRAEPAPVLMSLLGDPGLAARCRLDGVVVTVDAQHAQDQFARFPEFARQLAFADRVVLTKTDLVDPAAAARVRRLVRRLAPRAPVLSRRSLPARAARLFGAGLAGAATTPDALSWLRVPATAQARHGTALQSIAIRLDQDVDWEQLHDCLLALLTLQGEHILRMKGVLRLRDHPLPVALHAVHHHLHAPVELPSGVRAPEVSTLVFITEGLSEEAIREVLAGWGLLPGGRSPQ